MSVKIDNLKVPSQYILKRYESPEPLILDCEYNLPADEKGFVLKWYLNDQLIYQWISTTQPRFYVHVSSSFSWLTEESYLFYKFFCRI